MILRERIIKGDSLRFTSGLEVKHPTVEEILDLGFDTFYYFAGFFMFKPQDLIIPLWGQGIYYEDITHDELFLFQINKDKERFLLLFKIFTNCKDVWIDYSDDMESDTVWYTIDDGLFYLGYEGFDAMYKYFKEIFLHNHSRKRYFSGVKTREKILDEDFEEYKSDINSEENKNNFSDMISYLIVSNKREWEYVYSYPMARFYEEYIKTYKKQEADYMMFGIYTGNIDGKKIQTKKLEWYKTEN